MNILKYQKTCNKNKYSKVSQAYDNKSQSQFINDSSVVATNVTRPTL